ncbi:PAS domain-containing protein [Streptomyces sp. NPDC001922]|uniref:PAS domain-containing protein n=1 Tax=Streptomyces sp. NPDC001922 TaxID=3364624 RepID=UPI0036C3B4F8
MLERILALSPAGMAVLDRDLRFVWVNDALERLGGLSREQRLGKRLRDVLPLLDLRLDAEGIESLTREVLDTGRPLVDHLLRGGTDAHPHRPLAYSLSVFRLHSATNRVLGVSFIVLDVTDRWRARERLALLNEVGAQTGSTLDVMDTAQTLADISVPRLADFVAVDLLESVIRGDTPRPGARLHPPRMRRAGQQSIHEGVPESVAATGQAVDFHPHSPEMQCMLDGRSRLEAMPGASTRSWFATDPARAAKIQEFGLCSLILVPILALGDVLGVVRFIRWQLRDPFEQDDLLLAEEVVARAAVSIDNARRYTRQHSTALALQRSLLPRSLTGGSTLDVADRLGGGTPPAVTRRACGCAWHYASERPGSVGSRPVNSGRQGAGLGPPADPGRGVFPIRRGTGNRRGVRRNDHGWRNYPRTVQPGRELR